MEDIARQLDSVRDEMVQLLRSYPYAAEGERAEIYRRCEFLGGEIQELIGVLKLAIRNSNREASVDADQDPSYWDEVNRLSTQSLCAIHSAGEEVAAAITMLRESRGEDPDLEAC
jgi:hypothetical protein